LVVRTALVKTANVYLFLFNSFSGKGNKQVLANNDEISLAVKKNKGKFSPIES